MQKYLILLFIFLSVGAKAQKGFFKVIDTESAYEAAYDIIEMPNEDLVIACPYVYTLYNSLGLIIGLNKYGETLYTKYFVEPGNNNSILTFHGLTNVTDKLYIVGVKEKKVLTKLFADIYILGTDSAGVNHWSVTEGDSLYNDVGRIIINNNNEIYVLADKYLNYDPTLVKLDTLGNVIFNKSYNAPFMYGKSSRGIIALEDSTLILAGYGNISSAGKDKWMIRIKDNGDTLFSKVLTNNGDGWVTSICKAYDNSFYIAGNDLNRFDFNGNFISKRYEPEYGTIMSMAQTLDSNYVLVSSINWNFALTKIDTMGNVLWSKQFDNNGLIDVPTKVIATKDGGYAICGGSQAAIGGEPNSILVIKTDGNGDIQYATGYEDIIINKDSVQAYPNPFTNYLNLKGKDIISSKLIDARGQIIVDNFKDSRLNTDNLPVGTYHLIIQTKSKVESKKVLKVSQN